jgi:hypothetical protein
LGKSGRQDFTKKGKDVPGPGAYQPRLYTTQNAAVFGSGGRLPKSDDKQTPAPGSYEIPSMLHEGPQYSMKGRTQPAQRLDSPGPGQYNYENTAIRDRSPTYKMGSSKRSDGFDKLKQDIPGPGSYQDMRPSSAGPKWGFGTEDKSRSKQESMPGPGAYELPTTLNKISYSMSGRHSQPRQSIEPAPGSYDPRPIEQTPAYSFGNSGRYDFTKGKDNPAPGTYDPKPSRPSSAAPVFGSEQRRPMSASQAIPGPGSYQIPSKVNEGPSYSMSARNVRSGRNATPGPGQYNAKSGYARENTPAFSMGRARRGSLEIRDGIPGPGTYSSTSRLEGPKYGFGSEPRDKNFRNASPGPGAYSITDSLDRKAFSMSGRRNSIIKSETPGPGAYEHSSTLNTPTYKFGKGARSSKARGKDVPGPGSYQSKSMFNQTSPV